MRPCTNLHNMCAKQRVTIPVGNKTTFPLIRINNDKQRVVGNASEFFPVFRVFFHQTALKSVSRAAERQTLENFMTHATLGQSRRLFDHNYQTD